MATLGKQIQGGLKDAGKAVTTDAAKGVAEAGKQVVEDTLSTGAEKLSGGVVSDDSGQQTQVSIDPAQAAAAAQRDQAARQKIARLQGELKRVVDEKKQKEEQVKMVVEEQKKQREEQEDSSRKKRVMNLISKAKKGGGTGETARQKS